ncbi:MAG: tRNA-dihydrouridine synthase family protein [Aquificota bacterium]
MGEIKKETTKGSQFIKKGEVILAPMAGYTHSAFRRFCRRLGADRTYTELISAPGIVHRGIPKKYAYFTEEERPIHVQLFGRTPEEIAAAAVIVARELKPDAVDINFGCSVPKVLKTGAAGKLMETPKIMGEVVRQTVEALKPYNIPVTAKIRLGLEEDRLEEIAEQLIEGGVSAIALHPRLGVVGYAGEPDWKRIRDLKKISPVPVIGSGGVKNWRDIDRMMEETGCDAVMVGRAALSNPWIFKEYKLKKDLKVSLKERLKAIHEILQMMFEYYPSPEKACFEIRSILVQFLKGFTQSREIKSYLMTVKGCEEFINRLLEVIEKSS